MSAAVLWTGLSGAVAVCCWLSWVVALGIIENNLSRAVVALTIGLALGLAAAIIGLATSGIGMGDAKLLAPVAAILAWLGNQATTAAVAAITIAVVVAAGWALLHCQGAKTRVPLGPILTCGLIAGVVGFGFAG